jgi:lipopolysaccharide/colanic/teichoic acid biosynthesis glycosyltransferase
MYKSFLKRVLDICCAVLAMILFCWLYAIIIVLVRVKLGTPVIFKQPRPGKKDKNGQEKIFYLYKFRTMTDERDREGKLLADEVRLTTFGKKLRDTSLDELPEFWNILKGDMSVIGPRPQLVRDMVFMTDEHRNRHNVRPGLSGLAQGRGRSAISWEDKLNTDLEYMKEITFLGDVKIIFETVIKVFKREGITEDGMATAEDFGDYLLRTGIINREEYMEKQNEAIELLGLAQKR